MMGCKDIGLIGLLGEVLSFVAGCYAFSEGGWDSLAPFRTLSCDAQKADPDRDCEVFSEESLLN